MMKILIPIILFLGIFTDASATEPMRLVMVRNAAVRRAVCNDGTPAGYYLRRGSGSGSERWVIHLQGGGFCKDIAECNQRAIQSPGLMSGRFWAATFAGNGVLSASSVENPDFYNANHVFVRYCSSDLWSGNRPASPSTGGWQFRGNRIVQSVITDLKNPEITAVPNLAQAKEVLFSGSSAGGVGVLANLDRVARRLPEAVVKGVADAGWVVDVEPYDPSLDPPAQLAMQVKLFWHGRVDASCAVDNPFNPEICYLEYVYPYIESGVLIQMSQYDTALSKRLGLIPPFDREEEKYAEKLAKEMRKSLRDVNAAFSPDTRTHSLLGNDSFGTIAINGYTLRDVLGNWFFERNGPIKLIAS